MKKDKWDGTLSPETQVAEFSVMKTQLTSLLSADMKGNSAKEL